MGVVLVLLTPSWANDAQILGDLGNPSRPQSGPLFQEMPSKDTGIDFTNLIDNDHPLRRLYISGFASSGVAVGDIDGDGLPDLYLTRGPGTNVLYRQTAPFQFEDVTAGAGVTMATSWSSGAAFADVNGDGHTDLYVCAYDAPNALFLNDGTGKFTNIAKASGVDVKDASLMAHFQDYDRDGDLDMYLLTNRLYRAGGLPTGEATHMVNGVPQILPEFEPYYRLEKTASSYVVRTVGREDGLFRNDGTGKFTNVSKQAGISGRRYGLSATWIDYDHDGHTDLYVANDFKDPDCLYRNQGDGTFKDVIQDVVPHTPWFSMGSDAADLNNDGLMDLLVLDMSSTSHYKEKVNMGDMSTHQVFMDTANPRQLMRNAVFINSGAGRFLESAHMSGLSSTDWSWAVKLADFDNDGLTDVFVTNGMAAEMTNADLARNQSQMRGQEEWDYLKDKARRIEPNLAFRNRDGLHFESSSKSWGLDHEGMSYGSAWADFDRDGCLDLVVAHLNEPISVYRNQAGGHRLLVTLQGNGKNPAGLGARLTIRTGERTQARVLNPGTGFVSSNDPVIHVGLGDVNKVDELVIEWPSGTRQVLNDLAADKHYQITESKSSTPKVTKPQAPWFEPHAQLVAAKHMEVPFDDFAVQPLLPNKLSQLGPGIAIGDIEGDGDEDIVVGAARGENPHLHFQDKGKVFWGWFKGAKADALCEDMAPLLFDADGDGDLDWFVVSGGVEMADQTNLLRDRLYVNISPGNIQRAPDQVLPNTIRSGSVAAAADYDRDGDLDLFIGGRVQPGKYPLSPGSALWRNESAGSNKPRFIDATTASFKGLSMVTSALWSDINGDGWIDLLVATEWGPVRTFINQKGDLKDATLASGIAAFTGWWNGLAASDLDHDGDMDYIATNFGHNTKYHPTPESPSRIYYGTFGSETIPQIIEAKLKDGKLLPVRGKSCSQNAMPFVRQKFSTYHSYALASLPEIYTNTSLDRSAMFEVNTLDTSVLINDGNGKFTMKPLPALAQIAPGFGVVATEVNGDGHPDIYLVQNFHTPQRETGKMAGGLSALLIGDGQGNFEAAWPSQSGLVVPGDAKGLATADFNDDGWADFALSVNNAPLQIFENQEGRRTKNKPLSVTLRGKTGNPTAVGARLTVILTNGPTQTVEIHAGGGYLSQSSAESFFGLPNGTTWKAIDVRWPDGSSSKHKGTAKSGTRVILAQP